MSNGTNVMHMLGLIATQRDEVDQLNRINQAFLSTVSSQQPSTKKIDGFTVDSSGAIKIEFLGAEFIGAPRLVRESSGPTEFNTATPFMYKWTFTTVAPQTSEPVPVWSFYLATNGRLMAAVAETSKQADLVAISDYQSNDLANLLLANVYRAYIQSGLLQP